MNTRATNLIAAVLVTLVVLSGYTTPSVASDDLPAHIHLTWQRNDTSHTITVTWQTATSTAGDTVLYDTVPRNGNVFLYRYSAAGNHHTYSGASGFIHDVDLIDLASDTLYYFICGGEGGYSSERCFRTAPSHLQIKRPPVITPRPITRISPKRPPRPPFHYIRFVVGGDSRTQWWERNKISSTKGPFNPSFVLFAGDLVDHGDFQVEWDNFFGHMDTYWIGQNSLTIPIMPCLGNHEYPFTKYFEQFALPYNEQWYSFNWGPDIHIICLNSETDLIGVLEQQEWLENDLLTHASCKWKIVFFHRHPFPASHGAWTPALEYWVPLFDKYHVNIVFNGHSHAYYRSKPITWAKSQTKPQPNYKHGTLYLISGGWGAPLLYINEWWGWACAESIYNFVVVDVYFNSLHLQAKDNMGNTFDEIWIHQS